MEKDEQSAKGDDKQPEMDKKVRSASRKGCHEDI
jgi:hypothetical protein